MWEKIWAKLKEWGWLILVAIIGLLALGQKPRWVKEKEREIKQRDKAIDEIRDEREKLKDKADKIESSLSDFDKVVKEQDERIAAAGKDEKPEPLTDPSDIASFIKVRSGRK